MNRDCGEGRLIPHRWIVVYCASKSDREQETVFEQRHDAVKAYEDISSGPLQPCSNIRLYACDKQGYQNCLMSTYAMADGHKVSTDRMGELDEKSG